jgi:hypothetical protein
VLGAVRFTEAATMLRKTLQAEDLRADGRLHRATGAVQNVQQ